MKQTGKWMVLVALAGLLLVMAGFVAKQPAKTEFDAASEMIVMREIAHRILLYTGDSTTPVLPVTRLSASEYKIPFETSFSFKPDSLVRIIGRIIKQGHLPSDYIVQVTEPTTSKVIFGYAILGTQQQSIVPCNGRAQPSKPYTILVSFKEPPETDTSWLLAAGGLLLAVAVVVYVRGKRNAAIPKPVEDTGATAPIPTENPVMTIGKFRFYPAMQQLQLGENAVALTSKEASLLELLAASPGLLIERSRLQKIWEDEGVIVGRSLDVFVSRLRKKLEADPSVKIQGIHGRGYRLEVGV